MRARLSETALARKIGKSRGFLRSLESGANPNSGEPSRPKAAVVVRIAEILEDEELRGAAAHLIEALGLTDGPGSGRGSRPVDDSRTLLNSIKANVDRSSKERTEFMHAMLLDRVKSFDKKFEEEVEIGHVSCSPEYEPFWTLAAVQSCRRHLRAVSYEDLAWWDSPAGESYRMAHEDLRRDGDVEVTRIFVVSPAEYRSLLPTLEWHRDRLEVDPKIIDARRVPEKFCEDYIICDENLLRTARPVASGPASPKEAEFTDNHVRIKSKLDDFEKLLGMAVNFQHGATWRAFVEESDRSARR